jgi:hypothetical protein
MIDFSPSTNPAIAMEWTDAAGTLYSGQTMIPPLATDTTGGAFPGGNVRYRNIGQTQGQPFDLLVTVSETPSTYSEYLDVAYWTPMSPTTSQALFTSSGFVCLGFGLRRSYCYSGAELDPATASCADGTPTTMRAAEFDFTFVYAGTHEQIPPFNQMFTTFFDVDGDSINGGSVYELNAVLGATSRSIAPSAEETLEADVFPYNEALYAISTQNVNVNTDFSADPLNPPDVSLPAVVSFSATSTSQSAAGWAQLSHWTGGIRPWVLLCNEVSIRIRL